MMPPNNESVSKISKEEGIPDVTLYKWRRQARAAGVATPGNGQTSDKWSSQDKFLMVMETFMMNEIELAEYCRKKVLYREQIEEWKRACLQRKGTSRSCSFYYFCEKRPKRLCVTKIQLNKLYYAV